MRVLGIDPGLVLTGYGCVDAAGGGVERLRLVEAGVLRLKARTPMASRLADLRSDLCELLDELRPELVAVEQLFAHYRHARTGILMGHARGVVLMEAGLRGLPICELLPTAIKKATTGRGHASKRQVQLAVMAQFGLAKPPSPPDVADAIAIAACAARRHAP